MTASGSSAARRFARRRARQANGKRTTAAIAWRHAPAVKALSSASTTLPKMNADAHAILARHSPAYARVLAGSEAKRRAGDMEIAYHPARSHREVGGRGWKSHRGFLPVREDAHGGGTLRRRCWLKSPTRSIEINRSAKRHWPARRKKRAWERPAAIGRNGRGSGGLWPA